MTTAATSTVASILGQDAADLCDQLAAAESECFRPWCDLVDGRGKLDPDAIVATQRPLHDVAEAFRRACAASPAAAEQARQALLRQQAEGAHQP